jgi:hypothetical protein
LTTVWINLPDAAEPGKLPKALVGADTGDTIRPIDPEATLFTGRPKF